MAASDAHHNPIAFRQLPETELATGCHCQWHLDGSEEEEVSCSQYRSRIVYCPKERHRAFEPAACILARDSLVTFSSHVHPVRSWQGAPGTDWMTSQKRRKRNKNGRRRRFIITIECQLAEWPAISRLRRPIGDPHSTGSPNTLLAVWLTAKEKLPGWGRWPAGSDLLASEFMTACPACDVCDLWVWVGECFRVSCSRPVPAT